MKQMKIIKRSGEEFAFDVVKIEDAIRKASQAVDYKGITVIPLPLRHITDQNHRLIEEMKNADFDGFIRLDPTLNQAVTYIHQANEHIVRHPQGSFPIRLAYPMVYSTMHLIKACEKRYGREKVKPMRQAFCKMFRLWFYSGEPRCPSELYAKKLFREEDNLIAAMCAHNRGIVEPDRSRRPFRNPRDGSGLHGKRTKMMRKQFEDFKEFVKANPIFEKNSGKTTAARANQFWAAHENTFKRAAQAKGEKRGYPDTKALASAYRTSKS